MTTMVQCECGRPIPEKAVEALMAEPQAELECSVCKRTLSYKKIAKSVVLGPKPLLSRDEINNIVAPVSLGSIGATHVLETSDLLDLNGGTKRVAQLMADGREYEAEEIKTAAGEPGAPASEGLRRMRDLRKIPGIVVVVRKKPGTKRTFVYRLIRVKLGASTATVISADDEDE